jgi:hypothetical protein
LLVPLVFLPLALPASWQPPFTANPSLWLLALLVVAAGAPFFAVSTTSPVMQSSFAAGTHARAAALSFLYTASNLGCLLTLVAYPFGLEPYRTLATQARLWSWGKASSCSSSARAS